MTEGIIHLIDPDPGLRDSLLRFFETTGMRARGYRDAEAFLAEWDPEAPGCLIMELYLSGMSGIDLQQHIRDQGRDLPIIFISEHADVETAVRAVQNGAVGFLTKPFSRQVLLENLRSALAQDEANRARRARREAARERIGSLSPRERQVFDLVVRGCKNHEIADELDLSQKTVEMHRSRMMTRLEAGSVVDLVELRQAADLDEQHDPVGSLPEMP